MSHTKTDRSLVDTSISHTIDKVNVGCTIPQQSISEIKKSEKIRRNETPTILNFDDLRFYKFL